MNYAMPLYHSKKDDIGGVPYIGASSLGIVARKVSSAPKGCIPDEGQPYMKAKELQELGEKKQGSLTRGKARKLKP
ncbi:hypothetical protein MTR_3g100130 [Medicago truncatula]|uniref:Uncharacterized protein n=1 Tax=Medicago truncatula TaxID=3880 RepID=G7J4L0_MEDTR|nr:hypothetical protein MTR_3g100130 [Medicago truncatula]